MKYTKAVVLILLLSFSFFMVLPVIIERSMNGRSSTAKIYVSDEVKTFHNQLLISDMHADSLLWKRDLATRSHRGHLDIPRLMKANVALQFFSIVTKTPENINIHSNTGETDNIKSLALIQLWPYKSWSSLYERARYQANKLHAYVKNKKNKFRIITDKNSLKRYLINKNQDSQQIAGVLSLEGAHAVEENLDLQMRGLFDLGIRMMAPTHFFDNKIAGSLHGVGHQGLTKRGKEFVKKANQLGIILDVAHASEKTIEDMLELSKTPLVVSHTGLKGHCNNQRNLSDELAKKITAKGGLIGIGFWPTATCGNEVDQIADAIIYAVRLVGDNHVALGSDFDGAVKTPFDVGDLNYLTQKLIDKGLAKSSIEKVMGKNTIRFLLKYLPN